MTTASITNMRKCRGCDFYQVLNDHHIVDGHPYWSCSKGEHPDWCSERRKRLAEERLDKMIEKVEIPFGFR